MRAFDISIKVGNGYTSKQSKSGASVGSDVLERIIDTYPELNPLWLVTGKDTMIIDFNNSNEPLPDYGKTIDEILENKIKRIVQDQLKDFSNKLENFPTLDQISKEIQKNLKGK
ncbi:hypothetical protein IMCC3317_36620 [Kordia antarctica]|uniref:Uncharacterized protein n=2 Tax=Kordia antarctica TaxID=1218801 RepID=A0A7L4ZNN5_9FLAO|nr:hypothetical protein IMCC3317_36620 [Kordia antarctica]